MALKSYADIRNQFTKQVTKLGNWSKETAEAVVEPAQPKQLQLEMNGWTDGIFALEQMGKPFSRQEHNQDAASVVSNGKAPGVIGDLTLGSAQGDFLAAYERSFRLRHASPIRLMIHSVARKYGHGHAAGVFRRGLLGYLTNLAKANKEIQQ